MTSNESTQDEMRKNIAPEQDVEGHKKGRPMATDDVDVEGHKKGRPMATDEDDVEGHKKGRPMATDGDDDVEGHIKARL